MADDKTTAIERVAISASIGGVIGFTMFALFVFYANWFDAHHIIACSDRPYYMTAVTRWEWVRSWVLPVHCGDR